MGKDTREDAADFRMMFNAIADAVFILGAKGQILTANLTAVQRYGYSAEELRHMTAADLTSRPRSDEVLPRIHKGLEQPDQFEWIHRQKDGSELQVEIFSRPIIYHGEPAVLASVRDIRERKRLESEMQEQRYFLERVLNTEPGTVYVFDIAEQRNVYVNRHWPSAFGYTLEETQAMGDDLTQLFHPHDLPRISAHHRAWRDVFDEETRSIEYRLRDKAGEWHWLLSRETPFKRDADGKVSQILGIAHDISARKVAEESVRRLTQLYAALSQCNQTIVRCTSEAELLAQVCRDAVNFGGMKMAWIGMVDEANKRLAPVAAFGTDVDYLDGIEISVAVDKPTGHGPSGTSIREDRPVWCQDFQHDPTTRAWHERSVKSGLKASASLPLYRRGVVIGAFSLYADVMNAFDEAAQNLLTEMATDISYALDRFDNEEERKQEQTQLRKLSQVVEQSHNVIIITDLDAHIEYVNPAFVAMTGYTLEEVIGKDPRLLQSGKTPTATFTEMKACRMRGEIWQGEFINKRKDGTEYIAAVNISPICQPDGRVTHYLSLSEDITERKRAEERIQYLANFDALTGLPSRIQLNQRLNYAISIAKRNNAHLAVMFLDLDRFKDINDTLGHSVGDAVLIEVANRLQQVLRDEDTVSRLGGDEFILMLSDADAVGSAQVAQKLLAVITEPYHIEPYDLAMTASIGIALYPADGTSLESLSKNADTAMYRAKHDGRDCYRFFTAAMQLRATRKLQLVNALRQALERDQFQVHYQPQIANGRIIGAEALLRWQHPELGSVSPVEFIPVAEDCGLILPIGEWVLRAAVQQLKRWLDDGYPPMVIAVNLSVVQFRYPSLPDLVTRILDDARLPAQHLELELTEGVAMDDPQGAIAVMNNLYDRGVHMSIDDFGTGYSSLNYLKKFKVYKLKIDQTFVRDILTDSEDRAIVAAIISMAKNLGLVTIAEGVESSEQLAFLYEQGCDEIQGYYYSEPLPAAQFEAFMRNFNRPST